MLFLNKQLGCGTSLSVSKLLLVFLFAGTTMASSCRKEKLRDRISDPGFFKNANDAFQKVQNLILRFHSDEKLEAIERISYLNGKDRSYAFVDYKSNRGSRNIIIEKTFVMDEEESLTSYQCDGTCNCLVTATVSGGVLKFKCSCESCDMISH